MLWFQGSIDHAIASAKQQTKIFVVVITGTDEQSARLMSSWEDDNVSEAARNCVAIKVDARSETCVQFSQIYTVMCIPSSFFIGENGKLLEVIAGSVSAKELTVTISKVKQMHALQMRGRIEELSSGDASKKSPVENPETRAEDTRADRREHKKKEEQEIKKEMERRKMEKEDTSNFKDNLEDLKNKQLLDEWNRKKAEHKADRERVKQQIALDSADRAARYQELEAIKQAALQAKQAEQDKKEALVRDRRHIVNIQFRLPDGSSFTNQFPSDSSLQEVQQFAVREVAGRSSYGNVSLATMFPPRRFTDEDLNKTLLELDLIPSASILLMPQTGWPANPLIQYSGGAICFLYNTILNITLYPLLAVWRYFRGHPALPDIPQPNTSSDAPQSESFKKDGNVNRLRTQEDSDDDNNTWNGNSTQQM